MSRVLMMSNSVLDTWIIKLKILCLMQSCVFAILGMINIYVVLQCIGHSLVTVSYGVLITNTQHLPTLNANHNIMLKYISQFMRYRKTLTMKGLVTRNVQFQ